MDVFPDSTIVISRDRTRKMEQAFLPIEPQSYDDPIVTQRPLTDPCAQEDTRVRAESILDSHDSGAALGTNARLLQLRQRLQL